MLVFNHRCSTSYGLAVSESKIGSWFGSFGLLRPLSIKYDTAMLFRPL